VSAVALYLALRGVHWHEVSDAIREANYALVALAAALLVGTLVLRAARWGVLFHPDRIVHMPNLFGALNVAYLINNVLPLQLGDLARAYLMSELEGVSATRSFSTVVVERLLDVFTLLVFLLVLLPFIDVPHWARTAAIIIGVSATAAAVIMIVAARARSRVMRVVDWGLRFAPEGSRGKLTEMAHSAIDGFAVLAIPRVALELAAWSLLTWLAVGTVVYTGMQAFDLGVGYEAAMFVLVATSFGFFVPSSPGSFGVYHAITIATLTNVFDVDKNAAVSYALVIHLVFYLPPTFIGLAFLWSKRSLWRATGFLDKLRQLRGVSELDEVPV
jgi:uncharacterized protein (TIRG00374 family)